MREQRSPARVVRWLALPIVVGAAALLGHDGALLRSPGAQVLWAQSDPLAEDLDLDGLCLHQEQILGTKDNNPDTDGDHADDLVELARGTDPTNAASVPVGESVAVGMSARADGSVMTFVIAIYASYAQFPMINLKMGAVLGNSEILLSLPQVLKLSTMTLHPGIDPTGWIIQLEMPVPTSLLASYGSMGVYTLIYEAGNPTPKKAAVLNLMMVDGQPGLLLPAPIELQQQSPGTIYKPIGRPEDIPASWDVGKICYQQVVEVGLDGKQALFEVEAATCEALDSTCSAASCAAQVGSVQRMIDPFDLLN